MKQVKFINKGNALQAFVWEDNNSESFMVVAPKGFEMADGGLVETAIRRTIEAVNKL